MDNKRFHFIGWWKNGDEMSICSIAPTKKQAWINVLKGRKNGNKYIVKVSINGRQVLRRKYLGKTIDSKAIALQCEKDLLLRFEEHHKDYSINDLFNLLKNIFLKDIKKQLLKDIYTRSIWF